MAHAMSVGADEAGLCEVSQQDPYPQLWDLQQREGLRVRRPNVHISGVAFSHDGRKLFASYTNEQIYSFSCKQHQRAAAYFEAPDPSAHATR